MGVSNEKTIKYKNDSSIIDLADTQMRKNAGAGDYASLSREATAPDLVEDPEPEMDLSADNAESLPEDETETDARINQSNYLRYLADMRKADSELALAKAESAELVRLMDSYKDHYTEYEKLIHALVIENNASVSQQLDILKDLAQEIKKTSASLDSRIDNEIKRLTMALAKSIQKNVKDSCDMELTKVGEATRILSAYSSLVRDQYDKFERIEGLKSALFIISSICSPIVLILLLLNLMHII